MQKVVSFLFVLLGFCCVVYAQKEKNALELVFQDGNKTVILLQDKPVITFSQDDISIESKTFSTTYMLSTLKEYHFIDSDIVTGIESTDGSSDAIILTSDELVLKGLGNKNIDLFDLKGKRVPVEIVKCGDSIQLPFSNMMPNICIIKVDNKIFKIKVR